MKALFLETINGLLVHKYVSTVYAIASGIFLNVFVKDADKNFKRAVLFFLNITF
jgi:hypothetical protein